VTFKPGDKAIFWTGPGHQSRWEVTILEGPTEWGEYSVKPPTHSNLLSIEVYADELEEWSPERCYSRGDGLHEWGRCKLDLRHDDHHEDEEGHTWL
jgi:hypothetical protein